MLGINCLVKNTTLRHDLNDLVEYLAYSRISSKQDASIQQIYNDIRKSGIEVDLQTVGHIYNDVLPKSYEQFSSDQDVNDYVLKDYNDAIRRAALLEPEQPVEKQIGDNKPSMEVVNGILNMFNKLNTPHTSPLYSDMRMMQEALWKGANRLLNIDNAATPNTKQEWQDLLEKALGYNELGLQDVNGELNNISKLYEAMQEQLNDSIKQVEDIGDYATAEKYKEMVADLKASTYSLLFQNRKPKILLQA